MEMVVGTEAAAAAEENNKSSIRFRFYLSQTRSCRRDLIDRPRLLFPPRKIQDCIFSKYLYDLILYQFAAKSFSIFQIVVAIFRKVSPGEL
jgi:hypothetical protein